MRWFRLSSVILFVVLAGCDSTPTEEPAPSVHRVQFMVSPTNHTAQWISARRTAQDSFETSGQLLLEPGQYTVDLNAYDEEGTSITAHIADGPPYPLLRYDVGDSLVSRVSLRETVHPPMAPLDSSLSRQTYTNPLGKTTPIPSPRFRLTVEDTSSALGTIRLVYERYEEHDGYRRGREPMRIDFDVQVRLRTVPSLTQVRTVPSK